LLPVKFALVLLAIATSLSAETKPLRVLCWNLHHGVGEDGKLDLERISKVIREAKPDLVALQEVDNQCSRSGKIDQAAELAKLTGMTGVFGKAMDFQGGGYGQAILSRYPITSHKVHTLPGKGEPRIALEAIISNNGFNLRFISAHLDLEAAQRLAQAEVVAKLAQDSEHPIILCGDFNDTPGSPPLAAFAKDWKAVPKKEPVLTCPAGKPDTEIDHFFTKGISPTGPLAVLPEAVASDHRPLLAEFTWK
jgi:endonuclease/exonuclease/phosphatase family metal-dependent hydrolase